MYFLVDPVTQALAGIFNMNVELVTQVTDVLDELSETPCGALEEEFAHELKKLGTPPTDGRLTDDFLKSKAFMQCSDLLVKLLSKVDVRISSVCRRIIVIRFC